MSKTFDHNKKHLNATLARNDAAVVTGGTCPKCGEGANPTILARFGHCIRCQSAMFGR